ncbi:MAG: sec-independent protein translocase protein TatB [Pseudohongiellaceae bacterium]|jgi:sec-independent protein translocase protein TatB
MFDIGFQEILMVSVLALLVMGPERLPGAIRTGCLWLAKVRRSFSDMKDEIEKEVGINANDINLQLHNERVLKSIEENKKRFQENIETLKPGLKELKEGIHDFADYATSELTPPPVKHTAQAHTQANEQRDDGHVETAPNKPESIDDKSPDNTEQTNSNKPL